MTQTEAKQAMREGKILTHTYFTPDEFIYCYAGFRDEKGYFLGKEFWDLRKSANWQEGWELYYNQDIKLPHTFTNLPK